MNFKNIGHGFCAEGSHVADTRAIFENSSWFESSFDFSEHEDAQFRDGRFFFYNSQTHAQLEEMAYFGREQENKLLSCSSTAK